MTSLSLRLRSLRRPGRLAFAFGALTLCLTTADAGSQKSDADSLQRKLIIIYKNASAPAPGPHRTPITEAEVNAYFKVYAADQLPPGVVDPEVSILGDGRLGGRATVDLAALTRQNPDSWAGTLTLLAGNSLPLAATGVLRTKDGVGRLEIERVEVSGIPVPPVMLQQLVSYYSKTSDDPDGVRLDDPFKLPAAIREIQIEKGRAVIVQ